MSQDLDPDRLLAGEYVCYQHKPVHHVMFKRNTHKQNQSRAFISAQAVTHRLICMGDLFWMQSCNYLKSSEAQGFHLHWALGQMLSHWHAVRGNTHRFWPCSWTMNLLQISQIVIVWFAGYQLLWLFMLNFIITTVCLQNTFRDIAFRI